MQLREKSLPWPCVLLLPGAVLVVEGVPWGCCGAGACGVGAVLWVASWGLRSLFRRIALGAKVLWRAPGCGCLARRWDLHSVLSGWGGAAWCSVAMRRAHRPVWAGHSSHRAASAHASCCIGPRTALHWLTQRAASAHASCCIGQGGQRGLWIGWTALAE